ncbi:CopG family transcriptional regulator [Paenibacillus lycopersici]|uniref:CopG family transcriptional regulator n=1 Tax=Paenibacillus lycopersici TaxID=2704462 RepID=A0A6C0G7C2_9BACL|nr:ribbon-helix-helix domain-containing protein [Paenibacillus lycopersici]QHT63625.1 CopG family transcriptional regulator [Paenibacillus lycopersici]
MSSKNLKLGDPGREGQLSMLFTKGGPREGAGRKAIGVTRKVSLTLPEASWAEFDALCERQGCSKSELLREIIRGYLQAAPPPGEG